MSKYYSANKPSKIYESKAPDIKEQLANIDRLKHVVASTPPSDVRRVYENELQRAIKRYNRILGHEIVAPPIASVSIY